MRDTRKRARRYTHILRADFDRRIEQVRETPPTFARGTNEKAAMAIVGIYPRARDIPRAREFRIVIFGGCVCTMCCGQ